MLTGYLTALVGLLAGCGGFVSEPGQQDYPSRPLKLVVPFAPGGGSDTFGRIMEQAIREERLLSQPMVILNLDGAGGTIGSRRVKNAAPDGYTLLLLHEAIVTARHAGQATYGPEAFEAVAATGKIGQLLVVRDDSPYQNLRQLLQQAESRPETIVYGANLGAPSHFSGLLLEQAHGLARFRFAQTGGGAKRFSALIGGHIELTSLSIEEFLRLRPAGIRALAYLDSQRHPAAPQVPTAREQGWDIVNNNMHYWWVPKGTSSQRIEVLAAALEQAMQSELVQQKMAQIHCEPVFLQGLELQQHLEQLELEAASVAPGETTSTPNIPALVLIALTAAALLTVFPRRLSGPPRPASDLPNSDTLCWGTALLCLLLTVAYVWVMALGWSGFRLATLVFVLAVGGTLARLRLRSLPPLIIAAVALSWGLHSLFTQVLVVDLP